MHSQFVIWLGTEVATMQEFFQGMRDVDRENEVHRILGAFKLNPFEQLGLRFDATVDDVKRAYRKSSLMVHPDKCKHPKAQDAFETLGQAQQQINNEDKMKELIYVLTLARGDFQLSPSDWMISACHSISCPFAERLVALFKANYNLLLHLCLHCTSVSAVLSVVHHCVWPLLQHQLPVLAAAVPHDTPCMQIKCLQSGRRRQRMMLQPGLQASCMQ